ncbi:N-acetylglucosamine-6-phosphate deacetylase [Parapedobacter lycopersici]|uniref:N-acetylglucosamine-6-phosphate deacetylase n=1 Tax=Parapedobacter lycopersici TaxID=1864939 RepID=UPI00214D856D|nr:N-acetylglucosamine-6-phosphate deacetylase [Parapedobacter lycopersici]
MKNYTAITNGRIYTGEGVLEGKALLIQGDTVVDLIDEQALPEAAQRIDAGGLGVAPGLIDLQIYGGGTRLFSEDPTPESLAHIAAALVQTGTTGFMLTLATNTPAVFDQAIEAANAYSHPAFMGLHFEGPYLNAVKRGAHPAELIRQPDRAELSALFERAGDQVKIMTIAPETFDADCLDVLLQHNVLLSAGHSNATYEEAMTGFDRGIKAATHLFNAMSPLHHREIGLPGATFFHETACASIIADGIHVDYKAVSLSKQLMGERLFLITDAVTEAATGIYTHVRNGDHFTLPDGTLSGSALSLMDAVANCVKHVGIPLEEALRMASLYPARLIGADHLGRIAPGARANLILFDGEYRIQQVLLDGVAQQ